MRFIDDLAENLIGVSQKVQFFVFMHSKLKFIRVRTVMENLETSWNLKMVYFPGVGKSVKKM